MKRYVLGFYFDGDKVLLISRTKPDWQRGKVNGVGGSIEQDEPPIVAMVREFREESGIETTPEQWWRVAELWGHETLPKTGTEWYMYVYRGVGEIPHDWQYETDEGVVSPFDSISLPVNIEQTARWLCGLCYDKSRGVQAEIEI